MLDIDILTDLTRIEEFSEAPKTNTTEMRDAMKNLAMAHLDELISTSIFIELRLEGIAFDMKIIRASAPAQVSSELRQQIQNINTVLQSLNQPHFEDNFTQHEPPRISWRLFGLS